MSTTDAQNGLRWYQGGVGRDERADPTWGPRRFRELNHFVYVGSAPTGFADPLGLERVSICCNDWDRLHLSQLVHHAADLQTKDLGGPDPGPIAFNPFATNDCLGRFWLQPTDPVPGSPETTYENYSPGECVNACLRVHEQVHRDHCRMALTIDGLVRQSAMSEAHAYLAQYGCLKDALLRGHIDVAATAEDYVFYFAGRPVGQLTTSPAPVRVNYLTADHLGTPILSTASDQSVGYTGGLEPFGRDWSGSAASNGVFLRFPGQWDDASWSGLTGGDYYNVHRWYQGGVGRYERPDPAWRRNRIWDMNPFSYAAINPTNAYDVKDLETVCCNQWDKRNLDAILYQVTELHAFLSGAQVGPPVPPLPINPWGNTGCDQGAPPYVPSTWYDDWSPGNCINACLRAHEQYHRDGCSRGDFAATLDKAPAYLIQIDCLEQIRDRDLLILDLDPLGPGNCNKESCP